MAKKADTLMAMASAWKEDGIPRACEHRPSRWVEAAYVKEEGSLSYVRAGDAVFRVTLHGHRMMVMREDGGLDLGWAELQAIKVLVWGDVPAVEVYPRESDLVDGINARHLWKISDEVYAQVNFMSEGL